MQAEFSLDRRRRDMAPDLRRAMRRARLAHGAFYLDQLREMLVLGLWHHGLEPAEYYQYGLCDQGRHDPAARRSFVGQRGRWGCGPLALSPAVTSRLGFERMMRGQGLPVAHTLARYGGSGPPAGVRHLADAAALGRFLRESADRRLFGKPLVRAEGACVLPVEGWEPATDRIRLGRGRTASVLRLQRLLEPFAGDGYLFQARLDTHADLAPLLIGALCTVRVLACRRGRELGLHRASWRIPAAGNDTDCFSTPGNLLGAVDPETGRVWRVVDDVHPRQRVVDAHPDSGLPLHRTLPDWTTLRATVLAAAELFPATPCVAFDVALTDDGPVLLSMAEGAGNPLLLQLAQDRGLDDGAPIGDAQPAPTPRRAA